MDADSLMTTLVNESKSVLKESEVCGISISVSTENDEIRVTLTSFRSKIVRVEPESIARASAAGPDNGQHPAEHMAALAMRAIEAVVQSRSGGGEFKVTARQNHGLKVRFEHHMTLKGNSFVRVATADERVA